MLELEPLRQCYLKAQVYVLYLLGGYLSVRQFFCLKISFKRPYLTLQNSTINFKQVVYKCLKLPTRSANFNQGDNALISNEVSTDVSTYEIIHIFELRLWMKVKNDPRSEFSNLSNWKEEA